jgi:hypothetical protein
MFSGRKTEKLRTPDDLERYVQVTYPSVWMVLGVCIALLAAGMVWGVCGSVATDVETTGVGVEEGVACFLPAEEASQVHVGDDADVAGEAMSVGTISATPISRDEARDIVGSDYLVSLLMKDDWAYVVFFDGDGEYDFRRNIPLPVSITTERIAPIQLILGGRR